MALQTNHTYELFDFNIGWTWEYISRNNYLADQFDDQVDVEGVPQEWDPIIYDTLYSEPVDDPVVTLPS